MCLTLFACVAALTVSCASSAVVQEPGAAFPEFALISHTGATVTQADLIGKSSVIWFYPKAATPG